jgi:hypothetical protein
MNEWRSNKDKINIYKRVASENKHLTIYRMAAMPKYQEKGEKNFVHLFGFIYFFEQWTSPLSTSQ